MTVGIVAQRHNDRALSLAETFCRRLDDEVVVDENTGETLSARSDVTLSPESVPVGSMGACDLVVSIGGDGTFLYAARGAGSTPIMGVNLGEVGFLNAISPEEAVETVLAEVEHIQKTGTARTRTVPRLRARGAEWSLPPALNEVVVQGGRRGPGGGGQFEVRVDGSPYSVGEADGVLIATPTGSTAYNLSEGGPLVHPDVSGFIVAEMAGDSGMRPLIVDGDSDIVVEATGASSVTVVSDGRARESLDAPATVRLARANEPVRLAGPPLDFFTALNKLA